MLRTRVIPCLLLDDGGLVKTVKFKNPVYIGDPINSIRIYNELGVDELVFLDIRASLNKQEPDFQKISEIASECFMPFAYGGGIKNLDHAKRLFDIGVEKLVINSEAFENPDFITKIAQINGSQAVVVAIDFKKSMLGKDEIFTHGGTRKSSGTPKSRVIEAEKAGAGEILLNSISRDGMMQGFDLSAIEEVSRAVNIPVIALGGAGEIDDIVKARQAGASAIGLGSMAVYQNKNKGILINFPDQKKLNAILN